jgi:hypothetical protein
MGRISGRVALVTGAARGQGRAHAVRLASEGADIIAFDICAGFSSTKYDPPTLADLQETARLVEEEGCQVVLCKVDARDYQAAKDLVDDGVRELGRLSGRKSRDLPLRLHVGGCGGDLGRDPLGQSDWSLEGAQGGFAGADRSSDGGSIIVTSSVAGVRGQPFLAP